MWKEDQVWTGCCLILTSIAGFPETYWHSRLTHLRYGRFAFKVVTSGEKSREGNCAFPYPSPFPLNVMCCMFLFSHILLSLPLIPTLSTSADGKDSKTQGHSKNSRILVVLYVKEELEVEEL